MDIATIDKNFQLPQLQREDVTWHCATDIKGALYGVFFDQERRRFLRMPSAVANSVNQGVVHLNTNTAGGRLRFVTDSDFIALKGIVDASAVMFHMPSTGSHCFSLYVNGLFYRMLPTREWSSGFEIKDGDQAFITSQDFYPTPGEKLVEIYFPLYNGVKEIFVGIKEGCTISAAKQYKIKKPVVYYGSSITQGGCASRPGNDYQGYLSRWYDCDYLNFGFSGSARGESAMAEYLSGLDASVFVIDYDFNAPTNEHLQNTHYPLYEKIRAKNPDTPIILISRPVRIATYEENRKTVHETYKRAKENGDSNVWFIDGLSMFGENDYDSCTVDGTHPNDLGFYRMAKAIAPILEIALKESI